MNDFDAKVFKDIATALNKSITDWFGISAQFDPNQIPQVRSYRHSFIARYKVGGSNPQIILVKIGRNSTQANLKTSLENDSMWTLAKNEMSNLQAIWQAFQKLGDPDLVAVQPLTYLKPWNAIVMLEVKAQTLRAYLLSPLVGFSQPEASARFISHLRKACKWLTHYHASNGGNQITPASKVLMQERFDTINKDVAHNIGQKFDAPRILSGIQSLIVTASGVEAVTQVHGDFHCSNILVTPRGQICVLDPRTKSSRTSMYRDLATLMIDLHLKPIPMLTGGRFTENFLEQSREAIIESSFKPGEFSQSLFNFYCACETAFKWSMFERDLVKRREIGPFAPLVRPFFTRYIYKLLDRLTLP